MAHAPGDDGRPAEAEQDAAAFAAFLDRRGAQARSFPSRIAARWRAAFGDRFAVFFFDRLADEPEAFRAEVLRRLGADPAKSSRFEPAFNRKARPAAGRAPAIQALMRERFAEERRLCAEMFGGPALAWPDAPY